VSQMFQAVLVLLEAQLFLETLYFQKVLAVQLDPVVRQDPTPQVIQTGLFVPDPQQVLELQINQGPPQLRGNQLRPAPIGDQSPR